jgi:hypothetical protein
MLRPRSPAYCTRPSTRLARRGGPGRGLSSLAGMDGVRQIQLRMLAPASLVLFSVAFLIVVVSSLGGSSGSVETKRPAIKTGQSESVRERGPTSPTNPGRRAYVVKPGDTLARIAEVTGVAIDRLLALNPTVDPHGLVTGQHIKLRE